MKKERKSKIDRDGKEESIKQFAGIEINCLDQRTVRDLIKDSTNDWLESMIKSGDLFTTDIYKLTELMDLKHQMLLFERIDQLSAPELVLDFHLDPKIVGPWLKRYVHYRLLIKQSNKQLTYRANTSEQLALLYYLQHLDILNLQGKVKDAKRMSNLLSFLLNRDEENIRRGIRDINIRGTERNYLSKMTLDNLLELAAETGFSQLPELVETDIKRLGY